MRFSGSISSLSKNPSGRSKQWSHPRTEPELRRPTVHPIHAKVGTLSLSLYLSMSCALSLSLSKKHENRWMDRSIRLLWNFVFSVFDFVLFVTSIFVRTRDSLTNCLCSSAVMLRDSQNPDSSLFQLVLYFLSRFRFLGKQTEKTGLFWLFVGVSDEWTGDTCAGGENVKIINPELWQACAGPLVNLPPAGTHVVYFPQGHSEQVGV